ncbi:Ig-like domain-containing protein [Bacillus sp. FJAT-49736]|uniref:Ig-like domain-containing protein n=1 Tax=Bacillus sp. FJAT-49736 TaxID=2833582 RepID=UPI001BCA0985|nr:Ig-like domain-containing protein [Bacillus sp. FJAT-49736]MBS4174327.1 Ig-like domain-containing protein [Bacillus sp. FJAT-49736]
MAYQPKSYRKFLAGAATAAVVASAIAPVGASAATATVKSVSPLKSVTAYKGQSVKSVKLPTKVTVTYTNGKKASVAVKWSTLSTSSTGTKTLKGTIKGTSKKATLKVVVKADSIKSVAAQKAVSVKAGATASLPKTVKVTYYSGKTANVAVTWGKVDTTKAAAAKTVSGTVKGTSKKASIKVTVVRPLVKGNVATVVDAKHVKVTFDNGKTVNVTLSNELEDGATTVDFTYYGNGYKKVKLDKTFVADPIVKSVSAINGSQLEVKFNKAVDQTSAENTANYTILRNATPDTSFTAELQDDGKTVILTFSTPVANTLAENFSVTIQNVLLEGSYYDTINYYATSLTVADTKAPEIVSVSSKTNADTASSVTVTFSEPVALPTLKVDGVTKSVSLSADGYTATINNLDLPSTGSHTIEAINLTDLSGNVTPTTTKSFTVTKDTSAASYVVSTSSDNAILLTFNKAMNVSSVLSGVTLKGEDLNDLSLGTDYTVSQVGTSNKVFKIQVLTNPFTTTKTSNKYTIVTKNTIADSLGNLSPATTNSATLSVDTTSPTVQSVNYVKDTNGKVAKLLVKYSESVTPQAGTINIVDLTDGTTAASVTATGTLLADGQTVEYTLASATALAGDYQVQLPASIVKDTSFAKNASLLTKQTVNFGAASSTALKVASATIVANVATVNFDRDVTYASATNPANYTINGVALPADTVITYATTKKVTFTLPTNFIATTDTGAVLRVANVKTPDGVTVSTNQTVVSVVDNTLPLFSKSLINGDGTVSLTFSEAVVASAGTIGDFTFAVNNKAVTVGNGNVSVADGTGSDAGKYVFKFSTSVATTAETVATHDATATIYFDVNGDGNYTAGTDILIQSVTGLQDADLANYSSTTYNASKFSSVVIGSIASPLVVKDLEGNALKGNQAITVK